LHPIAKFIKTSRQYPNEEIMDFFENWTALPVVTVSGASGEGGVDVGGSDAMGGPDAMGGSDAMGGPDAMRGTVGVGEGVVAVGLAVAVTGPSAPGDPRTILMKSAVANFL
jgi:hypothetical protein